MAKMFYTLEEAADKLEVTSDDIQAMASEGKLQQFRDRDKLMFKRDQVDAMAANAASFVDDSDERSTGLMNVAAIDSSADVLALETEQADPTAPPKKKDPRQETGVSIFDADELDAAADPMAQTQVTETIDDDEELALQSIGSGSGLLDLTREADDTSLGAELLDEIYPTTGESSMDSVAASGVFEEGLDTLNQPSEAFEDSPHLSGVGQQLVMAEVYDGAGSGFGSGMLFGALIALGLVSKMGVSLIMGTPDQLTTWLAAEEGKNLIPVAGGILVASIIFGLIGFFIGKSRNA